MWVDSHCHLDFPDFADEMDGVMGRAKAAGVETMLTIATHLSRHAQVIAVAERYDTVWATAGVHPHEAAKEELTGPEPLIALAKHPRVVGIGEAGLDFYYEYSPRAEQETAFRIQIAAARATQLPLIVHARDADEDVIRVLREEHAKGPFPGLIHCFTSGQALADCALELGFYISVSGIATFKTADAIRSVIETVPMDRLLVETDSPFLAPLPHRGRRNEPAFVVHTGEAMAALKCLPPHEIARQTSENFYRLFSKIRRTSDER